jgi:ABC-type nitrate/sulfonate/bicarbonate transport system substrate-binding protein
LAIPLNLVYRSRPLQYPLLAAMKKSGAWEKAGIDVKSVQYVSGAAKSDPMLVNGECDFIFGSHISPYIHRMNGQPFVYLGQTVNWIDDVMVSKEPITSLRDLEGKKLVETEGVTAERHHGHHPGGNHLLYLRREGADPHKITFVAGTSRSLYKDVLNGLGDAAFASPPEDEEARAAGLHVLALPHLPMINAATMTTVWPTLQNKRDLCEAVLKATLMGVHYIKTEPDAFWKLMEDDVAVELKIEDSKALKHLYEYERSILEPRLYPTAESVANSFQLAIMEEPQIASKMNPMSLWDINLLREIEESEFIDDLYGGKVPGPGAPPSRR